MKILQVCSATEMGGGEVHVADLVRALAARGHAVYMVVRPHSPLREPLAGVITSWHEMALRNSLDVQSARSIAALIVHHGIDIVHAHVGRDYLVAALACRHEPSAKLVLTRHHYLPLKRSALYRWMLGGVSAVIAVSESVRGSVIERLALPPKLVHTIPNWVDPTRFQRVERDAARALFRLRGSLVVACIGQITPEKGQEEFIRAAGRIINMRSDTEFLIVGEEKDPDGEFTAQLMKLSETLGLRERVRFMGQVRHMPELLAAVDVVVVPSWDEGFSLVTIEAMAAKRPVIASNVGGIAQIITDSSTGLLFAPRDIRALTEKLIWMLSDAPLRERLAIQAHKDVFTRFGREQIIDRIEELYIKVLETPDAQSSR